MTNQKYDHQAAPFVWLHKKFWASATKWITAPKPLDLPPTPAELIGIEAHRPRRCDGKCKCSHGNPAHQPRNQL